MINSNAIKHSFKVTIPYLSIGVLWILFSDKFLLTLTENDLSLTKLQTYKGWAFIIITSVILLLLLYRYFLKLDREKTAVTELKKSLEDSEKIFEQIFDKSGEAILLTITDGSIIRANPAASKMFGKTQKEICAGGRNLIVDKTDERIPKAIEIRRRTGYFKGELNFVRKDGSIFPCEVTSNTFEGSDNIEYSTMIIQDISKRKQDEKYLKRSSKIFEDSLNEIYLFDVKSLKFIQANKAALDNIGYGFFEIINLTPVDIKPEFTKEKFDQLINPLLLGEKEIIVFETIHKRKNGTTYNVEVHLQLLKFENEKLFAAIILDISDRKKAENELRESEGRYKTIIEQAGDSLFINDFDGNIIEVNQIACKTLGYTRDELLGMTVMDIENDFNINEAQKVWLSLEDEKAYTVYGTEKRKDGSTFPVEVRLGKLTWRGKKYFLGLARDITERKKIETKLQESNLKWQFALEGPGDGLWDWDAKTNKVFYSKEWKTMLGFDEDEISDSLDEWEKRVHPDDLKSVYEKLNEHLSGKTDFYESEHRLLCKDGNYKYILDKGKVLTRSSDGHPLRVIGTHRDITKIKLAEFELKSKNDFIQIILDNLPIGIALNRMNEGAAFYHNKKFVEFYGWSPDELKDVPQFFAKVYPDENYRNQLFTKIMSDIQSGDINRMHWEDCEVTHKDGSIHYVNAVNIPLPEQDTMVSTVWDITERKLAEQALEKSEKFLSDLIENSGALIYVKNIEGKYKLVNKKWESVVGSNRNEALGKTDLELFPDSGGVEFRKNDIEVIEKGIVVEKEEILSTKNSKRYLLSIKFPTVDEKGKINGVCGKSTEITAMKLAEQSLKESEEYNRLLIEESVIGLAVTKMDGQLVDINSAYAKIIGRTIEETLKLTYWDITPEKYNQQEIQQLELINTVGKYGPYEKEYIHKDGHLVPVRLQGLKINLHGSQFIWSSVEDITQQKKDEAALRLSRQEFQSYFDSGSVGMSVTAADKSWIQVNQKLCEMLGYTKDELIGITWDKLSHPDELKTNIDLFNQSLAGKIDSYELDKRFIRKDGKIIYVTLSVVCQRNDDGTVHHFLSSYNDITSKKIAEATLQENEERLRALTARLEKVREEERIHLSRELHDHLGQNLTGLKMDIAWLAKKIKTTFNNEADYLEKTDSMLNLIDETIVNVRQISSELRPNVLDYLGLIPAIEWQIGECRKRTDITCTFKTNTTHIDFGTQNNSSIFRIVQEAFTNVMRHSKASETSVIINDDADKFTLEITDNGIGIDEAKLSYSKSLGILGMKERSIQLNGNLVLSKNQPNGTKLILTIKKDIK